MKALAKKLAARLTRDNAKWFARVTLAGWAMQGLVFGGLVVCGLDNLPAMVSAKVANWVVFFAQCAAKVRG